jgi:hypothetical protein
MRCAISRFFYSVLFLATLLASAPVRAQSAAPDDSGASSSASRAFVVPPDLVASTAEPSADSQGFTVTAALVYTPPTGDERFRNFIWNAVGPVAFAGASLAGSIDQASDFPHQWGQGANAYGVRVASNLGISFVTATAQYSLAEAFHEDTAYYRCACAGFFPRFFHAAMSSVAARRGDDGHYAFSVALAASPFVGPMFAANTWIPSRDGPNLGAHMGAYNLLGQFAQDEALEFLYGGPHTLLGIIQRHLFGERSEPASRP